jgi:hypothetical protein
MLACREARKLFSFSSIKWWLGLALVARAPNMVSKGDLLKMYAQVLRRQRLLPEDMRALGHAYIRNEFREHFDKCIEGSETLRRFLSSWADYIGSVSRFPDNDTSVENANADQLQRLKLLERTIKG